MVSDVQTIEADTHKIEFKANLSLSDLISALKMLDEEEREFFYREPSRRFKSRKPKKY